MKKRALVIPAALLFLAACSDEPEPEAPAPTATPPVARAPTATLLPEDVEGAQLSGELACSFSEAGETNPVLIARADVVDGAHAEGLVKLGPSAVRLRSEQAGGFNALVQGATFTGGDLRAQVTVTSDEASGGGESPPRPATLELGASGLEPQRIEGQWTCGP